MGATNLYISHDSDGAQLPGREQQAVSAPLSLFLLHYAGSSSSPCSNSSLPQLPASAQCHQINLLKWGRQFLVYSHEGLQEWLLLLGEAREGRAVLGVVGLLSSKHLEGGLLCGRPVLWAYF